MLKFVSVASAFLALSMASSEARSTRTATWLRFSRTAPAPGIVAARHGHLFLEAHVEGDTRMAYDANSGGHATRIHARSLRGNTVVNPRAA
jgi:hypothetical protein